MKTTTPSEARLGVVRISGIDVAEDRFVSVNGPAMDRLPGWGMRVETEEVEYHLHPAIEYEVHYRVPFYVLIHAYAGADGRFSMGEGSPGPWRVEARTTCIVAPGERVRVIQTSPLEFLALGIAPERVERIARAAAPGWPGVEGMFKTVDLALSAVCAEIRRTMIAEPMAPGAYLDSLTDALLTRLLGWHLAPAAETVEGPETLSPSLARRVAERIEARLDGSIRVADLAQEAGLSRAHFTRAFTHRFGAPPRAWILSRRIARARTLLTETELSASDIALRCGFATPSHLTTAFRRELGLTPTGYRRALTKG
ncbi:MAG: AraC family transcriptional regulator [Pseudomonadota bacterium]